MGFGMLEACVGQDHLQQQPGNWLDIRFRGLQEVRWDREGTVRAGDYIFYGKGNEKQQVGTGFFVQHRIVSTVKRLLAIGCQI
jgi:hypothetical protein